jgi:hypothetical protein
MFDRAILILLIELIVLRTFKGYSGTRSYRKGQHKVSARTY